MSDRRPVQADDLNLVPIMNLVTILIPFLLMAAQFVTVSVIDTSVPAVIDDGQTRDAEPSQRPTVLVTRSGYTVTGAAEVLGETVHVPCRADGCPEDASWDTRALTDVLARVKDGWPEADEMVIAADEDVSYAVLVSTMDAGRADGGRPLFPAVTIAGGASE